MVNLTEFLCNMRCRIFFTVLLFTLFKEISRDYLTRDHRSRTVLSDINVTFTDKDGNFQSSKNVKSLHNCRQGILKYIGQDLFVETTAVKHTMNNTTKKAVTVCTSYPQMCNANYGCGLSCLTYLGILIGYGSFFLVLISISFALRLRYLVSNTLGGISLVGVAVFAILILLSSDNVSEEQNFWTNMPVLINFYYLTAYSWMSILSTDAFTYIRCISRNIKMISDYVTMIDYTNFCIVAVVLSLAYGLLSLCVSLVIPVPIVPDNKELCWIFSENSAMSYFSGPIIILAFFTMKAFLLNCTFYGRGRNHRVLEMARRQFRLTFKLGLYLAILMHIIWIIGLFSNSKYDFFWYLYVCLNVTHIFGAQLLLYRIKPYNDEEAFVILKDFEL